MGKCKNHPDKEDGQELFCKDCIDWESEKRKLVVVAKTKIKEVKVKERLD